MLFRTLGGKKGVTFRTLGEKKKESRFPPFFNLTWLSLCAIPMLTSRWTANSIWFHTATLTQSLTKQILLDYWKISEKVSAMRIQITFWLLNSHFVTEPDVMSELFWIHIWMLAVTVCLNSGLKLPAEQVQMLFNVRQTSFSIFS